MKEILMVDLTEVDTSFKKTPEHPISDDEILYKVGDEVPFIFSLLHAIQILVCQVLSVVWLPVTLSFHLCILAPDPARVYLVSAAFFSSGVASLAQLPSVVTPSVIYASALIALLNSSSELQCPSPGDLFVMGPVDRAKEWQIRLREVQGALLFAGSLQFLLALSGIQSWIYKIISPPVMASAVILTGLSTNYTTYNTTAGSRKSPSMIFILFIFFGLILKNIKAPLPTFSSKAGLKISFFPVFKMFPVLWSLVAVYLVSRVLTNFGITILQQEERNIDFEEAVVSSNPLYFFVPFENGGPLLNSNSINHMLPAVFLQGILSYITFHGNAQTCCANSPPSSVTRRSLVVEGLAVTVGALWGNGIGSNPATVGLTHFTGIASRSCTMITSIILVILSIFPQSVLFLSNIPTNIISTINIGLCIGLVCIGMNIFWKHCEVKSTRDTTIFGFSLMLGLAITQLTNETNISQTAGFPSLDSYYLKAFLRSQAFIGVLVGCLLNAFLPGAMKTMRTSQDSKDRELYKLPTWEQLLCSVLDLFAFCSAD